MFTCIDGVGLRPIQYVQVITFKFLMKKWSQLKWISGGNKAPEMHVETEVNPYIPGSSPAPRHGWPVTKSCWARRSWAVLGPLQ